MASYLVYYANDLAKLSAQQVLNNAKPEDKQIKKQSAKGITETPISKQMFNGTTQEI
jgi:hypothetical protein